MTALLARTVQPPILTLLSSTSIPPISPLFSTHTDPSDPTRSLVTCLPDGSSRPKAAKRKWDVEPDERKYVPAHQPERGDLDDMVIHIQGPKIGRTFIQAGCSLCDMKKGEREAKHLPLGVELPWVHFQLKRLGKRDMAVEVGVVDVRGVEGVIRCSSFQETPAIHPHRHPPLIHLPLVLPKQSQSTMTQWLDFALDITTLLHLFQSMPRTQPQGRKESPMPNGQFGSVSYVRVYANCRVRRVWFSESGEKTMRNVETGEFALYASDKPSAQVNTPG